MNNHNIPFLRDEFEYELALRRLNELTSTPFLHRKNFEEHDALLVQIADYEKDHFPDDTPMFIIQ